MSAPDPVTAEFLGFAQGAMTLHLAFVGVSGGLFPHLTVARTIDELAGVAGADRGYTERWAEAAYAFGLLERHGETYALSERGRRFLPDVAGTLMPLAVQTVLSGHMADHTVTGLRTGARPGEVVLGERENVGRWFGPMLEASFGPLFDAVIRPGVPELAGLPADARVLDLACGNGWVLRRLAARLPGLTGVGVDGYAPNISDAISASAPFGDRLSFEVGDVVQHHPPRPYHLAFMHRALHHVWPERAAILARVAEQLQPGGAIVIWEPRWPDAVESLRAPALRPMAFQNLSEHVQGNRFLRPDEVAEALSAAGLSPTVHLFAEGREMVVVGRR